METNQRLEFVFTTMIRFRKLWLIPAVGGVVFSLFYVFLFRGETWSARQSLIVRDDLLGQAYKPGQFSSLESMKSAQETILEVARKPQVIRHVLTELGPAKQSLLGSGTYPDDETIETVQGMIGLSAPNGAELGKTEVIILNTKASTPERSKRFIELLLNQIDINLGEVREQRLMSMELELAQARDGAARSLEESTKKLREMDNELGADIGAMQGLNSVQGNDGLRAELSQIRIEKRGAQKELDAALAALEMLMSARLSPSKALAASSEFLRSQPKLEALQRSLVDAQKAYADHSGRYAPQHPLLASSGETVAAMQNQIFLELDTLIRSVESSVSELRQRINRLDDLASAENQKMVDLGAKRIDHLTINAEVAKKTEFLNLMQTRLSEIQAMRMSAPQVHWLTRVDVPQIATRPDGLGKKSTVLAGGFCGLMLGLGLVMLVAPPMESMNPSSPINARSLDQPTEAARRTTGLHRAPAPFDDATDSTLDSASHSTSETAASFLDERLSQAKFAGRKSAQSNETALSPLTIPHLDAESPNSDIGDQGERMRRAANLRPADIIRSAEELTEVATAAERNLSAAETKVANGTMATPDQLRNIAEAIASLGKLC